MSASGTFKAPIQREDRTALLRVVLAAAYVALFLAVFLPEADYPVFVWATLGPTLLALWYGPLDLLTSREDRRWYNPALLFNLAVFYYALKGVTLAGGLKPEYLQILPSYTVDTSYPLVTLYVVGGVIAWNWGYRHVLRRTTVVSRASPASPNNRPEAVASVGQPVIGVVMLSLVGLASLVLFSRSVGGDIFIFLLRPLQRSYLTDPAFGGASSLANLWLLGVDMFPAASMVWLALIGRSRRKPGILWWMHVSISIGIYLVIGGRADVLGLVLSLALVYHLSVSPLSALPIAGVGMAGVAYSYFVNQWRSVIGGMSSSTIALGRSDTLSRLSLDGLYAFLSGTDMTDIRLFVLIADAYDRVRPFQYGATLLRVFSQFVPRSLWPGKPLDLSIEIADLYRPGSLAGTPPGFFAEMYLNWHVFGVILGCALLGMGLAVLYRRWIIARSILGTVFYAMLVPRILLLPSATFANQFNTALVSIMGAAFVFALARVFEQSTRASRRSGLARQR